MTKEEVLQQINQSIIANGNEEITADVLRPILEAIVNQANEVVGNLSELSTDDKSSSVAAINEVHEIAENNKGIVIHSGELPPTETPPEEFSITDYYHQQGEEDALFQYNGTNWVKIE